MKIKEFFSVSEDKANSDAVMYICQMHFFWGIASSMIFSLLPVFIVDELGGSSGAFGLLEGSVIFLAFLGKIFAGFIMDIFKKKLPMLKTGAILTIISKFLLACSPGIVFVCIAKSIDRFAKGLRYAPSDTILAELSTKKGLAYSFRYMMNISGFLVGSVITSSIVTLIGKNFRLIFALAIIPTFISYFIFQNKVQYSDEQIFQQSEKQRWNIKDIKRMPKEYWKFITLIVFWMFNRFSEGFITLKSMDVLPNYISKFPLFMSLYEIFAICISILVGKVADQFDERKILVIGILALIIADIFGIFAHNAISIILIYIFAGIHIGATQGIVGSMIAKFAPKNLIGTAFAIYYLVGGVSLFFANCLAGFSSILTQFLNVSASSVPFFIGILFSMTSIYYLYFWIKRQKL